MHVRSPSFQLKNVPRNWFFDHPVPTHVVDALSIIFPAGERFFVRSVNHYAKSMDLTGSPADEQLARDIKTFFGQEGRHSRAHEDYIEMLETQGYKVRGFLKAYEFICFDIVERLSPPQLRLATTAACEHFTAIMAEDVFSTGALDAAHPVIRDLLKWHAAEEIEHRSVAFDVLQRVAPNFAWRVAGLGLAGVLLGTLWFLGTLYFLSQEEGPLPKPSRELRAFRKKQGSAARFFKRGIQTYLKRDFHPRDLPGDDLAAAFLASFEDLERTPQATKGKKRSAVSPLSNGYQKEVPA